MVKKVLQDSLVVAKESLATLFRRIMVKKVLQDSLLQPQDVVVSSELRLESHYLIVSAVSTILCRQNGERFFLQTIIPVAGRLSASPRHLVPIQHSHHASLLWSSHIDLRACFPRIGALSHSASGVLDWVFPLLLSMRFFAGAGSIASD